MRGGGAVLLLGTLALAGCASATVSDQTVLPVRLTGPQVLPDASGDGSTWTVSGATVGWRVRGPYEVQLLAPLRPAAEAVVTVRASVSGDGVRLGPVCGVDDDRVALRVGADRWELVRDFGEGQRVLAAGRLPAGQDRPNVASITCRLDAGSLSVGASADERVLGLAVAAGPKGSGVTYAGIALKLPAGGGKVTLTGFDAGPPPG